MKIIYLIILIIFPLLTFSQNNDSLEVARKIEYEKRILMDSIDGVYIPKDIDDCISQINTFWNDSIKNEIKTLNEKEFVSQAHFGVGMWLRNNWGLWAGSRLSVYFNNLGINHPDDMSSIISTSYHRNLTNKKIDLESQIGKYKKYWEEQKLQDELVDRGQTREILKSKKWIKNNNIKFYEIKELGDRTQFFTCDSSVVLKKMSGDTIFYWTTGSLTPLNIKEAKKDIKYDYFKKNGYISGILPDGRINFISLKQHVFVYRNDSLFEKDEYYSISNDSIHALFNLMFKDKSKKIKYYMDILTDNTLYTYKLIFTPSMFKTGDNFSPNCKYYIDDKITLEGYWNYENKKYYKILVTNEKEETNYRYFFDSDCKFIDWEGCNIDLTKNLTVENKKTMINE